MGFRARRTSVARASRARSRAPREWRTILALRPNVLIEGQESDVEKTLVALTGDFRADTCEWSAFDDATMPVARIIVREVTQLTILERQRLARWLNTAHPRVQLIATSSTPVFHAVEEGRFPADLYYRLNTVVLATAHRGAA